MEKIKNYENFEVNDTNESQNESVRQLHFLAKIVIILALIIVFEIIILFFVYSTVNDRNSEISNINYQKYILGDGNKKLDMTLRDSFDKDYAYDEEAVKRDNEIKSKEKLIKDYQKRIHKLEKQLNNTESLEDIQERNKAKKIELYELKISIPYRAAALREKFDTEIIDSENELIMIKKLLGHYMEEKKDYDKIKLEKIYSSQNVSQKGFDFKEANYKINFNENNDYLILFETNMFERYGIHLNDIKNNNNYRVFDLNNKIRNYNLFDSASITIKEKQNLKLMFNLVKKYKFTNKNEEIDQTKYGKVTSFEIFKVK
jgi:hypothetical protein